MKYIKTQLSVKLNANWVKLQNDDGEPPIKALIRDFAKEFPNSTIKKESRLACIFEVPYVEGVKALLESKITEVLQNTLDIEPDEGVVRYTIRNFTKQFSDEISMPENSWWIDIVFDGDWVVEQRANSILPVRNLLNKLEKRFRFFSIQYENLTGLSVIMNVDTEEEIRAGIDNALADMKALNHIAGMSIEPNSDVKSKPITIAIPQRAKSLEATLGTMGKINQLINAREFRELCAELVAVAPQLIKSKSVSAFLSRSYLFTIGDGCGLSTQLSLFLRLLEELKLFTSKDKVTELAPSLRLEQIIEQVELAGIRNQIICIDLSQWLDKIHTPEFRGFLRRIYTMMEDKIFVFRIPLVDIATQKKVFTGLSDRLTVRQVLTEPCDMCEIKQYASRLLEEKNLTMTEAGVQAFEKWVADKKSNSHFYGYNSINKIVDEIIYQKNCAIAAKQCLWNEEEISELGIPAYVKESIDNRSAAELLDELIGIEAIRKRIYEVLAQVKVASTDSTVRPCLHMRFVGAPGTGKTTVARILGMLMKEQNILSKGLFFEYAGRDFCGQYIGETAPKTAGICRDAYGSVLFIDEAYSLYRGDKDNRDFGREAIDTLVAQMENHRHDFIVIMAGYTEDMKILMEGNVGLVSRMPYVIEFPNYSRDELFQIFMQMAKKAFSCDETLEGTVKEYFSKMDSSVLNSKQFSNARFVRNLFERTWSKASVRHSADSSKEFCLYACDFESAIADKEFKELQDDKKRIGF